MENGKWKIILSDCHVKVGRAYLPDKNNSIVGWAEAHQDIKYIVGCVRENAPFIFNLGGAFGHTKQVPLPRFKALTHPTGFLCQGRLQVLDDEIFVNLNIYCKIIY